MNIESRHKTAFSTIAEAWLRGRRWSGHLAFVLGLFLPVLVWCAAISVSLPGPGISVPPHGHRGLSSGAKPPQPKLYYWLVGLQSCVQGGVKRAKK